MSNRLAQLRQRKAALVSDARAISDKADTVTGLSAEASQKFDAIMADVSKLTGDIEREERLADLERGAASGDAPAVDSAAAKPKNTGFKSFGEQLQSIANAGINKDTPNARDPRLIWQAAAGANEAVPSDGGFLVQTDFSMALLDAMHDMGEIMPRVRRIPISTGANGIKLPAIDESSRVNGSRFGGVQSYWANEAGTVTASRPKFRAIELNLQKLMGIGYATEELLQDAAALESVMQTAFAEELTFKAEDAIVQGTGSGQPLGWLNSGALVTVTAESGQAAATVRTENILKMWARMPLRSRKNAVWYINQDIEPQLYGLTLGSGTAVVLLYTPPGVNGNAGPYGLLMGRPVIPVEYAATLGTVGDLQLIDPTQYVMVDKGAPAAAQSMHVRFIYDEMTFKFTFRLDGQPIWRVPLTPYKGAATQSPFVALATRS